MAAKSNYTIAVVIANLCQIISKARNQREKSLVKLISQYWRHRKRRRNIFFAIFVEMLCQQTKRRFWLEPGRKRCYFFERTVSNWMDNRLWLENFRISKGTFEFIVEKLRNRLSKQNTKMRSAISVSKRLAISLWHLATGEDLRSLSWRFDIGKSTACMVVNEVCHAIVEILMPLYIRWPTGDRLEEVVEGFSSKWHFPQCAGVIDGSHIPIIAPSENSADFYNRKGFYSVNIQVVVDHAYRFTDINIQWPGKVHDARVLKNSSLYESGQNGDLFPDIKKEIEGAEIPIMLLGDAAYPLLPWLMKGYGNNGNLTQDKIYFNDRLSSARMVVEGTLGRLKGRFRCLLKRNDTALKNIPTKIAACCVLHNLCELQDDAFNDTWLSTSGGEVEEEEDTEFEDPEDVQDIRNALAAFLMRNK